MNLVRRFLLFNFCFCYSVFSLFAQHDRIRGDETWRDNLIEKLIEYITDNVEEQLDYTTLIEDLQHFFEHPLDLNKAERADIEKLTVLSDRQIEEILNYRKKYGPFLTLYELTLVPFMDYETILVIRPFVTVRQPRQSVPFSMKRFFRFGRGEIFVRSLYTLQEQDGYRLNKENSEKGYLGPPYGLFTRFRYQYSRHFSIGFTADKDAGEPFFRGVNKTGFDFYSGHLFFSNIKFIKAVAIGDYQCHFGQGLTLWSGLAFGKTAFGINLRRTGQGLRPYTSINENLFMRGGAFTIRPLQWLDVTLFYSNKNLDGKIIVTDSTDSDDLPEISSLIVSGLHRTASEIKNKGTVNEQMAGGHLDVYFKKLRVGFTGVYTRLGAILNRSDELYNVLRFKGNKLTNLGIDYQWVNNFVTHFGEISYSSNGGFAMIHGIQSSLTTFFTFTAFYRYFSPTYTAFYANAVADRRGSNNERGLYLGIDCRPFKKIGISGYFDQIYFPWPRYGVDAPSRGVDGVGQVTWWPARNTEIYFRLRHRLSAQNARNSEIINFIENIERTNLRFNVSTDAGRFIRLRGRAEVMYFHAASEGQKYGYMMYADITYKNPKKPLSVALRYTLFQTQDFDTRIYAYENDVLYYFSIPALFGRGIRSYGTIRWEIMPRLDLWFKVAHTWYSDRNEISSGNSRIEGNQRTDLRVQVRFRF